MHNFYTSILCRKEMDYVRYCCDYYFAGKKIAYAYAEGVNDNMTQSHFHDFFELYYLLEGERMHMIEGEIYHLTANDFVLFPPHIMHHSYGRKRTCPFKTNRVIFFS